MKKLYTLIILALLSLPSYAANPKVGIIMPISHPAISAIISGFKEELQKQYGKPIDFKVTDAQHDSNLQRAIITQMRDQNYTLIVPIGTMVTQMTVAMVKQQPIVSLAANFSEADRKKLSSCNITVVHDEIPPTRSIEFIHAVYPQLKNIVLIHSADDKVFPEVKASQAAATQYGMQLKPIMVQNLPDMYTFAQSMPQDTQAIFILKDNMIASGISTLTKIATDRHIPLITSDQGTVENGASFALGVHEKQIGTEGARLAAQILAGKSACSLPIKDMTQLTVFINKKGLSQTYIEAIIAAAKKIGYTTEVYS